MMKLQYILLILLFLGACKENFTEQEKPVAKVFDKYLLLSEVKSVIPAGSTSADSTILAQSYVRNWVTKQLLLHKANQNLSDDEKNIRKQVEDYSSSIIIHKYKEKLVSQKLNRVVSDDEITRYYDANKLNFILNTPVVRALFIVLPKSAINIDNVRKWFRSKDAKAQSALEEYCITSAKKYDDFNDQWIPLRDILNLLPISGSDWESKYKNKELIETEDDENYYFLKIHETRQEHETAPFGYVRKEIEILLLNKRKITFEEDLERDINTEGLRKDYVKIY